MNSSDPLIVRYETSGEEARRDDRCRVLIHNDEVTSLTYVLRLLSDLFLLSVESAEHVAETAQEQGTAVVVVRPQAEAKRLAVVANSRARGEGYPLQFTVEALE